MLHSPPRNSQSEDEFDGRSSNFFETLESEKSERVNDI